jgi:hypothetical protein
MSNQRRIKPGVAIPDGMMTVPAQGIQDMQRGYEMRIARQRDAIDRLMKMLDLRTDQFTEFCRAHVELAGTVSETDQAPVLAVAGGGVISDEELDSLLLMIPKDWDMYGENDTARSILAAYINYLHDRIGGVQAKEGHWHKEFKRVEAELVQARVDAKHNAEVANRVIARSAGVDIGDEIPPWEKQGSFVQPATVGTDSVYSNEPAAGISETLDWGGAKELPPGEERPSRSF